MTPLILEGWEQQLARMAAEANGLPSEAVGPFADPTLDQAEHRTLHALEALLSAWLLARWPWIQGSLRTWTPVQAQTWEAMTARPLRVVPIAEQMVQQAWHAGQQQAARPLPRRAERPAGKPEGRGRVIEPPRTERPPRGPSHTSPGRPVKPPIPLLPRQQQKEAEWIAEQAAAQKIRQWADEIRDEIRWQVVEAVRQRMSSTALAKVLEDRWRLSGYRARRIAVTELNAAYASGMLLALPEHTTVYVAPIGDRKVCADCKRLLEGKYFTALHQPPLHPTKYQRETCLWPAKNGMTGMNHRDWDPATPLHPFCRHLPIPVDQSPLGR